MICPNAGPIGREVSHPGPIVSYFAPAWGIILPPWVADLVVDDGLIRPEALSATREGHLR